MGTDVISALELVVQLLTQAQQVASIIAGAQLAGRDLTDDELADLARVDDEARARGRAVLDSIRAASNGQAGQPAIIMPEPTRDVDGETP